MQYLGSKNRISKHLKPIIESYLIGKKQYIEPFVGGANMIDKIEFDNKIGSDINKYLIALLNKMKRQPEIIPDTITEEEYNEVKIHKDDYELWCVGLVGFCASFGAKWFGGFARRKNGDDVPAQAIRNIKKQADKIKDIKFQHCGYENYHDVKDSVIYCDIPYSGTTKYKDNFDKEAFINFLLDLDESNTVLVSEYNMPEKYFTKIWEKEVTVNVSGVNKNSKKETEKLFILDKNKSK